MRGMDTFKRGIIVGVKGKLEECGRWRTVLKRNVIFLPFARHN